MDATYELFRAHFGRKDTILSSQGQDIRATIGIIDSTLQLLREPGVTHVGASFDTVIESFRNEMFPGYKSSAGMDEGLLAQFPLAEEALEYTVQAADDGERKDDLSVLGLFVIATEQLGD